MRGLRVTRVATIAVTVVGLTGVTLATSGGALTGNPTPREVTTTNSGQSQNSSIDSKGDMIVFTSNVAYNGASTFDDSNLGNGFTPAAASHPNPTCTNCTNTDGNGELYLWRSKAKSGHPSNSFQQLTNTTGGGFAANGFPDINQKGTFIAFDSDRDLTGGNADGNREIFLYNIATDHITQVTSSTGGGNNANRNASISDDGMKIAFDSNRDYAGVSGCTMADG